MGSEENNKNDNNKSKHRVVKFILFVIIIVIILLMHSCMHYDKINNLIPTGNIDIFDIIIDKSCCDDTKCECECKEKEEEYVPAFKPQKKDIDPYDDTAGAFILDKDGIYNNSRKLNIFTNPAYEFKNIIAPLSTNVYQFIVRNNNDFNLNYSIVMDEVNEYGVNMKYRLKLDGRYVKGDSDNWVYYDELKLYDLKLASNSKNVYQLEWKWFESDNDTLIGSIDADYTLKIAFDGEEVL